ncbi:MAG TPA: hypothetical protein VH062_29775 [Polyangiaceae bacterium]|nr:hypothetical protein [Polyangiaceae bacterium]
MVMSSLARVSAVTTFSIALGCASVEPPLPIPDGGLPVQVGGQSGASASGAGGGNPASAGGTADGAGGAMAGAGGTTNGAGGVIAGPGGSASGGMGGGAGTGAAGSSGNGNVGTCYPMGCPGCNFTMTSLFGTPCCTSAGKCGCQAAFTTTCM